MQTFDTPAPITAVLDIPAGQVRFIAGERRDTTVAVVPMDAAKDRDVALAGQTSVHYADGVLRIEAPAQDRVLGRSGSVDVTVQLPAGSHVRARAASGGFRAVGRFGDVAFDGAHGEVRLDEAASLRVTTSAGDVTVGRLTGPAEISTAKGDITVTEAVRGDVVLTTQSGDVSVGAARDVSAALDAGTTYGRIDNALRNTGGAPGLTIRATTAYGDIAARSL